MRRSNWKSKVLIVLAFILGIIAAIAVVVFIPEAYDSYRGLFFFLTLMIVSSLIVFIGAKVFRIGDD